MLLKLALVCLGVGLLAQACGNGSTQSSNVAPTWTPMPSPTLLPIPTPAPTATATAGPSLLPTAAPITKAEAEAALSDYINGIINGVEDSTVRNFHECMLARPGYSPASISDDGTTCYT